MIAQLEGIVVEKTPTRVVLDVKGVGYDLHIPVTTFEKLAEAGKPVKLLTYLHVRDDAMLLFGFATQKEKDLFSNLISVSGIGPKLAQSILSGSSVDELTKFIVNGEVEALTRLSGVGKKTAQRLVMELRDKFEAIDIQTAPDVPVLEKPVQNKLEEAVLALVSLGYNKSKAQAVLTRLIKNEPTLPIDELIKKAFQSI